MPVSQAVREGKQGNVGVAGGGVGRGKLGYAILADITEAWQQGGTVVGEGGPHKAAGAILHPAASQQREKLCVQQRPAGP